jgi:hypothetical protein
MAAVPITKVPDGMRHWVYTRPPSDLERIEIWREGMTETEVISQGQIYPAMNVYGLYWREPRERAAETSHAIN